MKIKDKLSFKKLSKKKKIIAIIIVFLVFLTTLGIAYGRYVYDFLYNHYIESKGFYFNSTTMSAEGSSHNIYDWDGVNPKAITIDVNSKKNEYIKTAEDVTYDITYECSENITCSVVGNKTSGTIRKGVNTDSYTIVMRPAGAHITGTDFATVTTTATSTYPYRKTLSTTYYVGITTSAFTYKIHDEEGKKFLELELNNSYGYFVVEQAFGSYQVGDTISYVDYYNLPEADRNKCKSAVVTIGIDNTKVRLDMNDSTFINKTINPHYETIGSYQYVSSFTFKMDANTTEKIIFYKLDTSVNYDLTPIALTISVETVD